MRWFLRAPGTLFEPLDEGWAAYSSLSGETHLLNGESVLIVEALDESLPMSTEALCRLLSSELDQPLPEIREAIGDAWDTLLESGLIREAMPADTAAP